jgi:hypothetical protein
MGVEYIMKNPIEIYQSMVKAGDEMADAEFQNRILNDSTKSVLAQLTIEARQVDGVSSQAEALSIALSASTYRDHIIACAEANRMAEKKKIRYYGQKTLSDLYRSEEASHRATMGRAT